MPVALVSSLPDVAEKPTTIREQETVELSASRLLPRWDGGQTLRIRAQAIWGSNGEETEKTQKNRYRIASADETPPARKATEPA
jgi:hypothetical protein